MGVREARSRVLSSPAAEDRVIVLVVLVEEVVEVVVVLAAALRPRGDFFCGDLSAFDADSVLDAAVFLGLFGVTAGGFSSFRLADLGLPRALVVFPDVSGDAFSSTIGEGLRLRPGDLRVPLRVAVTSWLDARVVRLLSIFKGEVVGSTFP